MQFIERGNCRMYLKKQFELSSNNDGVEDPNNDGVEEPFVSLDPALAKAGTDFETEVIDTYLGNYPRVDDLQIMVHENAIQRLSHEYANGTIIEYYSWSNLIEAIHRIPNGSAFFMESGKYQNINQK